MPLPSTHMSLPPPSNATGGATTPAPPPSMTGAIILDERMFEEEGSAPVSLAEEDLIDAAADELVQATGTIDIDESWLEDAEPTERQDLEPESFWMRGKAH